MYRYFPLTVLTALAMAGCTSTPPASKAADAKTIEETRAVAGRLVKELGGRLQAEMAANGPASAIGVCKQAAPEITSKISAETGWQIGRVGTRVRNPATGTANTWQQDALKQFAERRAKGEKLEDMEYTQVVQEGGKSHLRYAKAIGVAPVCTACHGAAESIPDNVKTRLKQDYPNDQATGYQPGDLRGAIVIRRPI